MLYYKKIDIDYYDDIVRDTLKYLIEQKSHIYNREIEATYNILDLTEFKRHCPKLDMAFGRYGLKCIFAVAFVMTKTTDTKIHIDNYPLGNARINIPIQNVSGSITRFFSGGKFKEFVNPFTNVKSMNVEEYAELKCCSTVIIDRATVIRVNEPHDVIMSSKSDTRITLSLGFDRDPVFLLD